jgi:hypothetical protein
MNQEMKEEKMVKKAKVESYDISRSDETMHLAVDLAKFIKENKLYQNIQGKEFVNVEGWQYAGSRLGIFPVVEHVLNVSTDAEMKYEAKVNLLNVRSGHIVGAGFAICSNKENGKKYYQEFAIASILAWIIRAAGYEPTPAEEMDYTAQPEVKVVQQPVTKAEKAPKVAAVAAPAAEVTMKASPVAEVKAPEVAPVVEAEANMKYATAKQKEEIIRLLNNVVITRQEKTKMLLNINKLDEERAAQSIQKLRKVIEEREDQAKAA